MEKTNKHTEKKIGKSAHTQKHTKQQSSGSHGHEGPLEESRNIGLIVVFVMSVFVLSFVLPFSLYYSLNPSIPSPPSKPS